MSRDDIRYFVEPGEPVNGIPFRAGQLVRDRNTNVVVRVLELNPNHPRTGNPRKGFSWENTTTRPGQKDHTGFCPVQSVSCFEAVAPTWRERAAAAAVKHLPTLRRLCEPRKEDKSEDKLPRGLLDLDYERWALPRLPSVEEERHEQLLRQLTAIYLLVENLSNQITPPAVPVAVRVKTPAMQSPRKFDEQGNAICPNCLLKTNEAYARQENRPCWNCGELLPPC